MERDLVPLDTTPGQSRGVQGLFDGAVEIELSDEEGTHLTCPPLLSRVKSIAYHYVLERPGHPGHLYAREG